MQKRVVVLSLGGSLIIPREIDSNYLKEFKETIKKNTKNYKFIVVCGGGNIARKYISALRENKIGETLQNYAGISSTRTNARFMSYFFNQNPKSGIPQKMEEIHRYLKKQDIVFCGALEYKPRQTSDSTAADVAKHFDAIFINLTNVSGLYDKNPTEYKSAKFIPAISWRDFKKLANKIKYEPGQHFVLDQTAAKVIMKSRIPTYILGKDVKQLDNFLNKKKFIGTEING